MRVLKTAAVALGLALVAMPVTAAVRAMTLKELMAITTDTVHGRITAKSSFHLDYPIEGSVWTKLVVQGESLRTGEPVEAELVFLGSHDPRDGYGTSEMPTLQDTRVGADGVFFYWKDADMPGQRNRIFDLSGAYRVETVFGTPVVIGKGEGAAFAENVKLDDARVAVRSTHLALLAESQASGTPAK